MTCLAVILITLAGYAVSAYIRYRLGGSVADYVLSGIVGGFLVFGGIACVP